MRATVIKRIYILLIFLLTGLPTLFSFENTLVLGEETGWIELVSMDNVQIVQGYKGFPDITLKDGEYQQDEHTDILLHFNRLPLLPPSHNYEVLRTDGELIRSEKVLGSGAMEQHALNTGLEWQPREGTILGAGSNLGDFSIEFWLFPTIMSDGEEFFSWKGMEITGDTILPQTITGRIFRQKIKWEFTNFFQNTEREASYFSILGMSSLLPRQWHHHLIRYNSQTGLLEYLVDGVPESITYTSPTEMEEPEIYAPRTGTAQQPKIILGGSFTGLIEEFRISNQRVEEPNLSKFSTLPGTAITKVIDFGQSGSQFNLLSSKESRNGGSAIAYYFRQSDTIFSHNENRLAWQRISPGEQINEENRGRYLQLKFILMPDGSGAHSPQLSSVELKYEIALPPLPPTGLTAYPGDGQVTLKWNRIGNASTSGYKLYFGTKPGDYFGTTMVNENSPIDLGNIEEYTLKGLQNGTLYYFAITAYGGWGEKLISEYSEEVISRPDQGNAQ